MSPFEKDWMKIFLEYGLNEHPAMRMIYEGYSEFYAGAKKLINNCDYMFDITDAFDNAIGVYTDGVHCDSSGNELLARAILEKLETVGELH